MASGRMLCCKIWNQKNQKEKNIFFLTPEKSGGKRFRHAVGGSRAGLAGVGCSQAACHHFLGGVGYGRGFSTVSGGVFS